MTQHPALPLGWHMERIGDLGSEVRDAATPAAGEQYELYSVPAFENGVPERLDGGSIRSAKRVVREGDLLLCKINPRINRVWIVAQPDGLPQLASTEYLALRLRDHDDSLRAWVLWYLRSPSFRNWIKLNVEGATGSHTRAKSPAILDQRVPVAPPDTRRRIVKQIEAQMTLLDDAERQLRAAKAKVAPYRTAVLNRVLPATGSPLPTGWQWSSVGELATRIQYGSSAKTSAVSSGVPVLRMGNIVKGNLALGDLKYLPADHPEFPDLLLAEGDLLFNRTNSPELVGKSAVYRGWPSPCSFASYLIRVRLGSDLLPEFLSHLLNGPFGRRWIRSVVSQQVGQANVNGSKLKAFRIPVPPVPEQQHLVQEADVPLSIIDKSDIEIHESLRRAHSLREAILRQAFAGAPT